MSNLSNLYAEKIFAEHPLALWSLDEKVDYLSLISEVQRSIVSGWNFSGASCISSSTDINKPFSDSALNLITFDLFEEDSKEIKFVGPDLESFANLDSQLKTISLGAYFYTDAAYLQSVTIGLEYTDISSGEVQEFVRTYDTSINGNWVFASHTIEYPEQDVTFRPVIKIKFLGGSESTDSYKIFVNGITAGQWAEEFHTTSLGTSTISFPSDINISGIDTCVEAKAYGLGNKSGYYLSQGNRLLAKNIGVPMVYGASNVTKLNLNVSGPSLIIPGFGFLNKSGKNNNYTVEMWMRINSDQKLARKIFGPISSDDGLYIQDGFLTLVIGNKFASHFVGEWYRPMLLQIRLINNMATMLINGEQVISLEITTEDLVLPDEYTNSKSNDWLAFYTYEDINPFEIDCIAIYSYQVPEIMAKRRWVYGQAVVSPESINTSYSGKSAYIDYPFAEYSVNYSYPNLGTWSQGYFDNLSTTVQSLNTPNYSLPEIYLDGMSLDNLYSDCYDINTENNKFFTFRPNSAWNNKNTYLNFSNFNLINDEINSIYLVFENDTYAPEDQILMKFYNTNTSNSFIIKTSGQDIIYVLQYNGTEQILKTISDYTTQSKIAVGFNLQDLSSYYGNNIATFFGNKNAIKFYVAGDETGDAPFIGELYSLGVSSSYNANSISEHFGVDGIAIASNGVDLLGHLASYTLKPSFAFGQFFLDIGVSSYWQDYLPLTYFAKYVTDETGSQYYDLDFVQLNIDYPSPSVSKTTEVTSSWTYSLLDDAYDHPVQAQYAQIDNALFTGWENYEDFAQKSIKSLRLDTTGANVKTYISLQYVADGANKNMKNFTSIELLSQDRVIDFSQISGWSNKLFEVVDNTIIYPPANVDFNDLAIVTHIDFNVDGILTRPISLKKLELTSQAFNHTTFNKIGTRFGLDLYPYKKTGIYYDYKSKNPFSIYKGSTPYLYTTRSSGIEVRGRTNSFVSRGITMPINENSSPSYRVSAMQSWLRYDLDSFSFYPIPVFEVEHKNDIIQIFAIANSQSGNRARIFAVNKSTGQEVNGLSFYLNGNIVREPVIETKQWSVLGISFGTSLNFDNYSGLLNLNGNFVYNNVTYFQSTALQQIQSKTFRPWLKVLGDGVSDILWQYWNINYNWDGVLVLTSSDLYSVNPGDVYRAYIGNNKTVIDSSAIDISFTMDNIKVFSDTTWQSSVNTPV